MTEPEISSSERLSRPSPRRLALLLGTALAIVIGAAVTMGASPSASPSASAAPGASTAPTPSGDPDKPAGRGLFEGRGFFGGHDRFGLGGVSISAISGSNLTLTTEDGWTRTIAVTSSTTNTKAGKTVGVGDLSVGDKVRFKQTRNADGTFTVTAIQVVQPSVSGTVSAKSATSITIDRPDGSKATVHVDGSTTYEVAGVTNAGLGDVAVGMRLVAVGTLNTDGSLDSTAVHAGNGFRDGKRDHDKPGVPAPSASPESPSSTG